MANVEYEDVDQILAGMKGVSKPRRTGRRTRKPKEESKDKELHKIDGEMDSTMVEVDTEEKKKYLITLYILHPGCPQMLPVSIPCYLNIYQAKMLRDTLFELEQKFIETNEPQPIRLAYVLKDEETEEYVEQTCTFTSCVGAIHDLPLIRSISEKI